MSSREGITGTGAIYYPADPGLLRGVLASEKDNPVYPDNYCTECMKAGVTDNELCFHQHWNNPTKGTA